MTEPDRPDPTSTPVSDHELSSEADPDGWEGTPEVATVDDQDEAAVHAIAEWLKACPAGVITWGDDHTLLTPEVRRASWIDVTVPAMTGDLPMNWVWTVVTPDDDDAEHAWPARPSWTIAVEPDRVAYTVYDPALHWYSDSGPVLVCTPEEQPGPEQLEPLYAHAERIGGEVVDVPAWRNETVSRALEAWTTAMTGRQDLVFRFDNTVTSSLVERLEALDLAEAETYDVGDGISVTAQVMDALLAAGPDTAAEVTETVKRVIRAQLPGQEPGSGMGR